MDIKDIQKIQKSTASKQANQDKIKIGVVVLFMFCVAILAVINAENSHYPFLIVFSALVGGYMAMNIGANDVANNVGPAVGSNAITLTGAIIIAAICEASGALLAGGDVVNTIKSNIIDPEKLDSSVFLFVMLAALLSGAIWVHLATIIKAPVSTTHSIVGGVLGAGIAAGGLAVANWKVMGGIALSWFISPFMGGVIAVIFLFIIKRTITYRQDKKEAAKKVVPILIFIMILAFSAYLLMKGFSKLYKFEQWQVWSISVVLAVIGYAIVLPLIKNKADSLDNTKESINTLFTIPLIFSAALLSFAHGANDVANAIGPLAAINQALLSGEEVVTKASVPIWIMLVGGLGISIGLALYGPRLIKTVGSEITELDRMRAFCIAMSAALTVLIASALGLPVSSTHIAIGAVMGVGFLREYLKGRYVEMCEQIIKVHKGKDQKTIEHFLRTFAKSSVKKKKLMLESLQKQQKGVNFELTSKEKKELKKFYKHELVKRGEINRIIASWLITVPASGLLGAAAFFALEYIFN